MPTLTRTATTVVVCTFSALAALLFTDQAGHAQTSQHRETDLDFISRLNSQADSLRKQVSGLDVRVRKLEETAAAVRSILAEKKS